MVQDLEAMPKPVNLFVGAETQDRTPSLGPQHRDSPAPLMIAVTADINQQTGF